MQVKGSDQPPLTAMVVSLPAVVLISMKLHTTDRWFYRSRTYTHTHTAVLCECISCWDTRNRLSHPKHDPSRDMRPHRRYFRRDSEKHACDSEWFLQRLFLGQHTMSWKHMKACFSASASWTLSTLVLSRFRGLGVVFFDFCLWTPAQLNINRLPGAPSLSGGSHFALPIVTMLSPFNHLHHIHQIHHNPWDFPAAISQRWRHQP